MTRIDFAGGGNSYYQYDADSKRVSQRTAEGFRQFVYQGPDMLKLQMERDESEETVAHYTMGAGLEAMRRDSASSFYHYNHLGTALALTGADEAVSDTYRHDAWGVLLASTGSTVNPHTYVGRERYYRMPNAEMYHLGFRDYAQGVGRFMTVDPLVKMPWHVRSRTAWLISRVGAQRRSLPPAWLPENVLAKYGYAINEPVSFIDPNGAIPLPVIGICIIGVVLISGCGRGGDGGEDRKIDFPRLAAKHIRTTCLEITPETYGCVGTPTHDDCCDTLSQSLSELLVQSTILSPDDITTADERDCNEACREALDKHHSGRRAIEACLRDHVKGAWIDAILNGIQEGLEQIIISS
jgi:hypothetical protein